MVMWSNFLRFVGEGITVGELPEVTGHPEIADALDAGRPGALAVRARRARSQSRSGTAGAAQRALRREWLVRPTPIGRKTQELAPPLFGEIEKRWEKRFGVGAIDELRQSLAEVIERLRRRAARVPSDRGQRERDARRDRAPRARYDARLTCPHSSAQVLLAYTLDFERESELSLPLTANFVRILGDDGLDVREVPEIAGVSPEATTMAREVPDEDRLRHGRRQARPAHAEGPGGAGGGSRAACRGRARRGRRAGSARRWPALLDHARASPRACTRIPKAGEPGRSTSTRRTPSSPTRPAGCRTTRWCSTAAGGPTAPSF